MDGYGYDLSKIPALTPPPGVVPNFVDPPTQAQWPKITTYVTLPITVVFLGLRIYARFKHSGMGVDDYLCFLSAASVVVYIALCFKVIEQAAGPHMWDIPLSKITVSYAQNTTTLALIYFVAAMFIKASILALYRRIFRPSHKANVLVWCGIAFSTLFYIASIAAYLATSIPRPEDYATGGWLSPQFAERAYSYEGGISAATGIIGTVIDFYILVVPLVFLWSLHMPAERKAGLSAIFIAGSAACIFSVIGAVYRMRISHKSGEAQDLSWNTMPIYGMSIAEINVGIACSCMPIIFVIFKGFTSWSASMVSRLRYLTPSQRKAPSEASDIQMVHYQGIEKDSLPSVPRGALSGVKSFMHSFNRTKPATHTVPTTNDLLTVGSAEYEYHEHLKQGATRSQPRSSG